MAYVPNNLAVFTAAFAGALAGMGASDRVLTDPDTADYAGVTQVAGAFAQALDTSWALSATTGLDIQSIQEACETSFQSRSPTANPDENGNPSPFINPTTYTTLANAIVAMVKQGDIYFAAQGIVPPSPTPTAPTSVVNEAALTALDVSTIADQTFVQVLTYDAPWELNTSAAALVPNVIAASSNPARRWFRNSKHIPKWTEQTVYKVSAATGSDENSGLAGSPLKTVAEFCRRVTKFRVAPTAPYYDVQCLDDIPATDVWRPTGEFDTFDDGNNDVYSVLLRGTRSTYLTGVVAAGTDVTVEATNTQAQFNGGVTFDPAVDLTLLGKMVVIPNGIGNGLDVVCWINLATAANQAQVSDWVTVNPTAITGTGLTALTGPQVLALVGQTYHITDTTKFECDVFGLGSPLFRHRFMDFTLPANATESFTLRCLVANFLTCRLQKRVSAAAGAISLAGCGYDFPALTELATAVGGSTQFIVGSGLRNVGLSVGQDGMLGLLNCLINAGYVRSNITVSQGNWGGNLIAQGFSRGVISVQARTGIFNSPVSGMTVERGAALQVSAGLYGSGNAAHGLIARQAGKAFILSTQTPTITGAGGDLQLEDATDALPALEASAGLVLPALAPLTTWAEWAGAPFTRNAMSYKTGAGIYNVTTT